MITKLQEATLHSRITRLKNINIQKSAQIRFYKQQLKSIKHRIESILDMDKPSGNKTFAYLNHRKKPNFGEVKK